MSAKILDGRSLAKQIQSEIAAQVASFTSESDVVPTLAAVLVGEDPASQVYVGSKQKACKRLGMESQLHRLPEDSTTDDVAGLVKHLNEDPAVHGILVQLPLPQQIDSLKILDLIDPLKDVDAFHPHNVGLLSQGRPRYLPCTPHGILQILARNDISCVGKQVAVIGRSDIVGKPIAMLLGAKNSSVSETVCNATVTLCHSRTEQLEQTIGNADIVIAAIGRANFVTAQMIKPGATVIDVGINRTDQGLVGDVDFEPVSQIASNITPVPGGIGPLTVTMLMQNTLQAAKNLLATGSTMVG